MKKLEGKGRARYGSVAGNRRGDRRAACGRRSIGRYSNFEGSRPVD